MSNNDQWQNEAWKQSQQNQQPPLNQPPAPQQNAHAYSSPPPQPTPAYQGHYQQPAPKKGKGWIVGLVAVILIFLLCAIGIVSCSAALSTGVGSSLSGSSNSVDYLSQDSVGVISIDGTIQYDGTTCSPEGLKEQLKKAENNSRIKAVVLRVNSGGGVATAGEEMTQYIKEFSKPVVVSSASINASAAYMISSQADYLYTAKTTSIGSIGTVMQVTDLSSLYEKLGINIENITSSDSKDTGYGTRPLTEEERAHYQSMVDQINETFLEVVADGRSMSLDTVRELATGMTFTGMEAVENGLADEVGTLEAACKKAASLAGISSFETVALEQKSVSVMSMLDLLEYYSSTSDGSLEATLKELESNEAIVR